MRPLTSAFSREELSELLDVPLDFVDALLDSGRVLCHVKGGQPRVPLSQLEDFFRDALLRLYQAEGGAVRPVASSPAAAADTAEVREPVAVAAEVDEPEPEPEEPMVELEETEPRVAASAPAPAAVALPIPRPAMPPKEEADFPNNRIATRYVPLRQLGGIFGETKFVVMQLSATGMRIRHNEPLMPGEEAKLSFALQRPARSVVVRARVVWTSLAKSGTERFSISGLRITEHQDRVAAAIDSMRASNELQPERRTALRRESDTLSVLNGISDEEMAMVTAAVQKFAGDPVEASRWYSRARFALSDENVRRVAPERPRDREEVLGIWEYLDRQIDIGKIAGIVTWMRSSAAGPVETPCLWSGGRFGRRDLARTSAAE
ncbi:MAG TPA: PilZ domain-containing protein, partial [Thermoanaerobaculia bacterium]|nr:PilZ domain-containing protein [Thermoanaerobaculia bacterium]